ncbi:CRISPR-associated endonuclease Cas2 [soil metagenome]
MTETKWWMVCYDVRDAKRLRKCAKHMEGYGVRVQYSIFRCWMSPRESARLRWELTEILKPEDEVLLIPLCSNCVDGIVGIHGTDRPPDWTDSPLRYQII